MPGKGPGQSRSEMEFVKHAEGKLVRSRKFSYDRGNKLLHKKPARGGPEGRPAKDPDELCMTSELIEVLSGNGTWQQLAAEYATHKMALLLATNGDLSEGRDLITEVGAIPAWTERARIVNENLEALKSLSH